MILGPDGVFGGSLLLLGCNGTHSAVLGDYLGLRRRGCVASCPLVGLCLLPKNPVYGDGFKKGFKTPFTMDDGYGFIGVKAYNDSKRVRMMTSNFSYSKFHNCHGVTFSSIYPSCIAETPFFWEKRAWFRR